MAKSLAKKKPAPAAAKAKRPAKAVAKATTTKEKAKPKDKAAGKAAKASTASTPETPRSAPIDPARLGTKRTCLKCSTRFYDFERDPIICPKCNAKFTAAQFMAKIPLKSEAKKAPVEKEEQEEIGGTEVIAESSDDFESVEDLADEESVKDLELEEDENEF